MLLALKRAGKKQILGVDSNEELLCIARTFDVPLVENDIREYLKSETLRQAVYFYLDVMEHVSLEQNLELMRRLPVGSRLIIQTPYTESVLGHRFYMNVPSHVAPYSPWVIKKMLQRFGYQVRERGKRGLGASFHVEKQDPCISAPESDGSRPRPFFGRWQLFCYCRSRSGCLGLTLFSDYPPNQASRDRLIQYFVSPRRRRFHRGCLLL